MSPTLNPSGRATILIVDDTPDNLELMSALLRDTYRTKVANRGDKALRIAMSVPTPDLILLDIMMPGMDGYEVCSRLKADPDTADIPVIFLTARSEIEDEQRGFDTGGVDYITKPVSPPIVLARVRTHLQLKRARDILRDHNAFLEAEVRRRVREIELTQHVTMKAMASLAATRDEETGSHLKRTQHYVRALAERLREHPRFRNHLDDVQIDLLFKSAPLHDIGKVGVRDDILCKPGRLTQEEFEEMKPHTSLGAAAIRAAGAELAVEVAGLHYEPGEVEQATAFLRCASEIAESHQEWWDGSGYPRGLRGEDIPVSARLMAVADVYDALISRRRYKPAYSHEEALAMIVAESGTHFDPDVVAAFLELAEAFRAIALRFPEAQEPL